MISTSSGLISVERALFGSSNQGSIEGYQLLYWTEGVDAKTTKELSQWAPTRMGTQDESKWSVQIFHSANGRACVSRTFVAGREYSQRGGVNVATAFLMLEPSHWARYDFDALAVFHIGMALGYLRWTQPVKKSLLPEAVLPVQPPMNSEEYCQLHSISDLSNFPIDEIADRLQRGDRIALVGANDAICLISQLITLMPLETRRRFSFTTGLPLSIHRPFQLHCLDRAIFTQQPGLVDWLTDCVYGA